MKQMVKNKQVQFLFVPSRLPQVVLFVDWFISTRTLFVDENYNENPLPVDVHLLVYMSKSSIYTS